MREQADEYVLVLFGVCIELPWRVVCKFDGPGMGDGSKFVISLVPFLDSLDSAVEIDVF